jgi:hypothetical protein
VRLSRGLTREDGDEFLSGLGYQDVSGPAERQASARTSAAWAARAASAGALRCFQIVENQERCPVRTRRFSVEAQALRRRTAPVAAACHRPTPAPTGSRRWEAHAVRIPRLRVGLIAPDECHGTCAWVRLEQDRRSNANSLRDLASCLQLTDGRPQTSGFDAMFSARLMSGRYG